MRYLRSTTGYTVLDQKPNIDIKGKGKDIPVTDLGGP
jgi:hypothetical protein